MDNGALREVRMHGFVGKNCQGRCAGLLHEFDVLQDFASNLIQLRPLSVILGSAKDDLV